MKHILLRSTRLFCVMAVGATALMGMAAAQVSAPPPAEPWEPVESDWVAIPDDDILVMTLRGDRRVVIRLASRFAPQHVANIRRLALAR